MSVLEERFGCSISEFIKDFGLEAFRLEELRTLLHVTGRHLNIWVWTPRHDLVHVIMVHRCIGLQRNVWECAINYRARPLLEAPKYRSDPEGLRFWA